MTDARVVLIEQARAPIKEVVDMFLEGMLTKEEAFDKIVLLFYQPNQLK